MGFCHSNVKRSPEPFENLSLGEVKTQTCLKGESGAKDVVSRYKIMKFILYLLLARLCLFFTTKNR
ncbi:hypothetical protein VIBNISFn118_760090 [Vibrio nigripulchritudo SFn118]|nr:hypothetical protein VIBNISFn118_760090 [Vibrio nigripulchritudo SFn118]